MCKLSFVVLSASLGASLCACSHLQRYVDVDALDDSYTLRQRGYIIGKGDTLGVSVINQAALTNKVFVRSDGKISLPFLGDVVAAGKSPDVLAHEIEGGLKQYLQSPVVTVSVEASKQMSIAVLGEVTRSGVVVVDNGASVLQAIAAAGGRTTFASNRVLVIRHQPTLYVRMAFDRLVHGEGKAEAFRLQDGDTIYIE